MEISTRRRTIVVSSKNSLRGSRRALAHDRVGQNPDPIDVKFDRVPAVEKAPDLQSATITDCPGPEELTGMDRFVLRRVGDDLLEGKQHPLGVASGARLAVDPNLDVQRLGISEFIRRDDPWADRIGAVEALALGGAEAALHFDPLAIAGGKVVEDRIAENVRAGLVCPYVRTGAAGHDADLELIVHHLAVARPLHGRARPYDSKPVGDVVDWQLAIDRGKLLERLLHHGFERLETAGLQRLNRPRAPT